jgi:hypothetical protein
MQRVHELFGFSFILPSLGSGENESQCLERYRQFLHALIPEDE